MTSEIASGNGRVSHSGTRLEQHVLSQLAHSLSPAGPTGRLWIGFLLAVMLAGLWAYVWQCVNGLKVTAMREYISWGVYMTNFVFFIGVSHAGTLISAILRVTNAEWRRSITRMAEAITVFALMVGAPMVIIDMGRPDRILNVLIHGRLNSPILWDVCSICTYLCGSLLYLYVAMIPDFALLAPPAPDAGLAQGALALDGREPLIHELHGHREAAPEPLGERGNLVGLDAVSARHRERQADHHRLRAVGLDECLHRGRVRRRATALEHRQRLGGQAERIAQRHADAPVADIQSQHAPADSHAARLTGTAPSAGLPTGAGRPLGPPGPGRGGRSTSLRRYGR